MEEVINVFPGVRNEVQKVMKRPQEEITLETDVYNDLGMDSLDLIELFIGLGERFDLQVPDTFEDFYLKRSISDDWEDYKTRANDMMFEHFAVLGFAQDATERVEAMNELAKKYHVQPFSVGFICAWIAQILHEKG